MFPTFANCARLIIVIATLLLASCTSSSNDDDSTEPNENVTPLSGQLRISVGLNGALSESAFNNAVDGFDALHPDLSVVVTQPSDYNDNFGTLAASTTEDIVSWFPGNRMEPYVSAGQFEDVSDLWSKNDWQTAFASASQAMTLDNKQWGVPYSTYSWGVYYRKDIFDDLNINEPTTWSEFEAAADTLISANITPLTIGTKFRWPAAGVFDYLNLRINGYEYHTDLTAGRATYTDQRTRDVFNRWKLMIDGGYFISGHELLSWQDAITPFADGSAAMYLMGNFLSQQLLDRGLTQEQFGFFTFPEISASVPRAEEAPTDALFIPINATNKEAARAFLEYMALADTQTALNIASNQLPVNVNSTVADDPLLQKGFAQISTANGLTQFFDRDAPAAMAAGALEGFVEFMLDPNTLESLLSELDALQVTAYP